MLVHRILIVSFLILNCCNLFAQNTPWDILYCVNGGENKSAGIPLLEIPNPVEKPGWQLVFHDEFNSDTLDNNWWNRSNPWDDGIGACTRNFVMNPGNISVTNGSSTISNTLDPLIPGCLYSGGEIKTLSVLDTTFHSFYFYSPGYLEARVKLFNKTGQGAAFWLWSVGTPENPGAEGPYFEIDVFELNGIDKNIVTQTYHWTNKQIKTSQNQSIYLTNSGNIYDLTENWTTFGLEWDTASIKWYVNNALVKELDLHKIPPYCTNVPRYSQPISPFSIRFTTASNTVGNQSYIPSPGDFPQSMLVDYVRVYKKSGEKISPVMIKDNQICATETSQQTTKTIISAHYYPGYSYKWTSTAFEIQKLNLPIPQPPEKYKIWLRNSTIPGQKYPIYLQTTGLDTYRESDTAFLYVQPDVPMLPSGDVILQPIDSLCYFTVKHTVPANTLSSEYSLDNGATWIKGKIAHLDNFDFTLFGQFKPEQMVDLAIREKNACGYSPVLYLSIQIPPSQPGCKWPTSSRDAPGSLNTSVYPVVNISPNPVSNRLHITISGIGAEMKGLFMLRIFNILGKKVLEQPVFAKDDVVNMSQLPNGLYRIQLFYDHKLLHQSSIIKN